jgi:hypothetical protein
MQPIDLVRGLIVRNRGDVHNTFSLTMTNQDS